MRIAHIINHLGSSGLNQVVADLVTVFNRYGHESIIYYLKECKTPASYPCRVVSLKGCVDIPEGFDVIHAHGIGPMLYVVKHKRTLTTRSVHPLFVTTLHCYCFQDLPSLYGWAKGGLMACAYLLSTLWQDRIVCLSKDMMHYYARWAGRSKLCYVYNTRILPDLPFSSFNHDDASLVNDLQSWRAQGYKIIGMNGVLIYRKGVDMMLRALRLLKDEGCRYRLVLVGDGKDKTDFVELCKELDLNDDVIFAGQRKDAYRFLPYYDLLALPSHSEGFSLSLLEAAAAGKNVVISNLPSLKECFSFQKTEKPDISVFEIVANRDETIMGLAHAIKIAIADENMGNRLRMCFENKLAPEKFYERYMLVYSKRML